MSTSVDPALEAAPLIRRERDCARAARVLFVLTPGRSAGRALLEAHECARQLDAELHLIRVVSAVHGAPGALVHATREAQRVLAAARNARRLCDLLLPEQLPAERICVRIGGFVDEVARRGDELDALLVVMAPEVEPLGSVATELAFGNGRPVLVPKEGASSLAPFVAMALEKGSATPCETLALEPECGPSRSGSLVVVVARATSGDVREGATACPIDRTPSSVLVAPPVELRTLSSIAVASS